MKAEAELSRKGRDTCRRAIPGGLFKMLALVQNLY